MPYSKMNSKMGTEVDPKCILRILCLSWVYTKYTFISWCDIMLLRAAIAEVMIDKTSNVFSTL